MKKLLSALVIFSIVPTLLFAGGRPPLLDEPVSLTDERLPAHQLQRIMDHARSQGKPHPKNAQARVLRFSRDLKSLHAPWQKFEVPTKVTIIVEKPEIPRIVTAIRSLRVTLRQGNGRAVRILRVSVEPEYFRFCGTPPTPPPTLRSATIARVSINGALRRALPMSTVPINLKTFFRPVLQTALRAVMATMRRA